MKKLILSLIIAGAAGLLVSASAQPAPGDNNDNTNAPPATDQPGVAPQPGQPDTGNGPDANGAPPQAPDTGQAPDNAAPDQSQPGQNSPRAPVIITPSRSLDQEPEQYQSNFMPPNQPATNGSDINLHYTSAPLNMVLNYLSDAAGFIVVQETPINSNVRVTVNGKHLTKDEAVDLLNSVLNQNGYAAIRDGRTLTIMNKTDAKTSRIPVKTGNDPDAVPNNAEIVTEIIPIRFVEAQQLVSDLSSFVSPQATVVANEAGNSIVITDTQSNIKHLMEIIKAVDDSAEAETEIQVFPLRYANPNDVANEISTVFPSSTSGNGSQAPIRFGGFPGGFGGGFGRFGGLFGGGGFGGGRGGTGGGNSSSSSDRIRKATQVNAVADLRVSAVIVTAPKDLMQEIGDMIDKLDVQSARDQQVFTFKLNNADPQQVAQVLQSTFGSTRGSTTTSGANQNSALQTRTQNNNSQMGSQSGTSGFGSGGGGAGIGAGRTGGNF